MPPPSRGRDELLSFSTLVAIVIILGLIAIADLMVR